MEREFKGIWIAKEVWLDKRLDALDKIILAEVDSLDVEDQGCFASNKYLAEFCQCSERRVSEAISKLIKFGFVYLKNFNGRTRILGSRLADFARQTSKLCEGATQKMRHNNIDNNKVYKRNNKRNEEELKSLFDDLESINLKGG